MKDHKEISNNIQFYDLEGTFEEVVHSLEMEKGYLESLDCTNISIRLECGSWGDSDHLIISGWRPMTDAEKAAAKRRSELEKRKEAEQAEKAEQKEREEYERLQKKFG